jgi:heme exporter protein A
MTCLLDVNKLACVRGGRTLFSGVTTQLPAGHVLRVHGLNGAGKTSLLRILCGLLTPEEGEVRWQGVRISSLREAYARKLIYLGHAAALKDDLSPLENLTVSCTLAGAAVSERQARKALSDAGLRGCEHLMVSRLSQGQRRRSALARLALGFGAPLWVLDEPFNALDVSATQWLAGLIRDHVHAAGMVVLTSHQEVPLDGLPQLVLNL